MLKLSVTPVRLLSSCQTGLESIGVGKAASVWVVMLTSPPLPGWFGTERLIFCGYDVNPGGVIPPPGTSGGRAQFGAIYVGKVTLPVLLTTAPLEFGVGPAVAPGAAPVVGFAAAAGVGCAAAAVVGCAAGAAVWFGA